MPTYSFKCRACGEVTIHNVPMAERDTRTDLECEVCKGTELKRMLDNPVNKIEGGRTKGDIYAGGIKPV